MLGGGNGPTITATAMTPQLLVTGRGFQPGREVTIRVINPDETITYFQHDADGSGEFVAALPAPIAHGTLRISATDNTFDPDDETGVRWTDIDDVDW